MSLWTTLSGLLAAVGNSGVLLIDRLVHYVTAIGDGDQGKGARSVAFTVAMIALSAKMAKADGVVTGDEEIAFLELFDIPSGEERNVARLFNLAKQDVAGFETYAERLAVLFPNDPETCIDILDGLFHIAKADGVLHENEIGYLRRISQIFNLDERMFNQMLARHARGGADPYAILGVAPEASDAELKSQFRHLVRETHPDRLIARGVPEDFVRIANDRLAALNGAWAQVAAERNL